MSDLANPYDAVLTSDPLALTPGEQKVYADLTAPRDHSTLTKIAATLGAAFIFQHLVASRMLKQKMADLKEPTPSSLRLAADVIYQALLPKWLGIATPALLSGYRLGVIETRDGQVPEEDLYEIAQSYAKDLGKHLNEVSDQALVEGFQAQINRKVPAARAAQQVADAYGVPPRAMNALITVWNSEDPKYLHNKMMNNPKVQRVKALIDAERQLRGHQIGESESWAARTQAKQIVWMYGMQKGVIPKNAKRTWVTARDEKVCKYCGPLHLKSAPIGEEFMTGYGQVWTPPLHINCRCDIILDFNPSPDYQAPKERISKAQGDDPYDRDRRGRFAAREGRGARPTRTRELYEQVQVPSISEQIAQQLSTFEEEKKVEAPAAKLQLPEMKQLPSLKRLPSMDLPSLTLPTPEEPKKAELPKEKLPKAQLRRAEMPKIQLPAATKQQLNTVLQKLEEQHAQVVETQELPFEWEPADFPIVFIVSSYEGISPKGHVLGDTDLGFRIGERAFDGHAIFTEKVQSMWDSAIDDIVENFIYGNESNTMRVNGEHYEVDLDTLTDVLHWEAMGRSRAAVEHYPIKSDEGTDKLFSSYDIVHRLGLDQMVAEATPTVIVTNAVRMGTTEEVKRGVWKNPGKWMADPKQKDLNLESSAHMPINVIYMKPAD